MTAKDMKILKALANLPLFEPISEDEFSLMWEAACDESPPPDVIVEKNNAD